MAGVCHLCLYCSSFCVISKIQILHCVERTGVEGGENQFVDGLHVAEQIREEFPDAYKLLTAQEVEFRALTSDEHGPFHLNSRVPTIQLSKMQNNLI